MLTQHCPRCRNDLPISEFAPSDRGNGGSYCITCKRAYNADRYRATKATKSDAHRLRTYDLSPEDYRALLTHQGEACAICRRPLAGLSGRSVHVDHCHSTGVVLGVLCQWCNTFLAYLYADPDALARFRESATRYLDNPPARALGTPRLHRAHRKQVTKNGARVTKPGTSAP